jgi:hypothetical protein
VPVRERLRIRAGWSASLSPGALIGFPLFRVGSSAASRRYTEGERDFRNSFGAARRAAPFRSQRAGNGLPQNDLPGHNGMILARRPASKWLAQAQLHCACDHVVQPARRSSQEGEKHGSG